MSAHEIAAAAICSADELRALGRCPVRIRMHPLDMEMMRKELLPETTGPAWDGFARVLGYRVVVDHHTRRGEPVAEFEEAAR